MKACSRNECGITERAVEGGAECVGERLQITNRVGAAVDGDLILDRGVGEGRKSRKERQRESQNKCPRGSDMRGHGRPPDAGITATGFIERSLANARGAAQGDGNRYKRARLRICMGWPVAATRLRHR